MAAIRPHFTLNISNFFFFRSATEPRAVYIRYREKKAHLTIAAIQIFFFFFCNQSWNLIFIDKFVPKWNEELVLNNVMK